MFLIKIRVTAILLSQGVRTNVLPKFIRDSYGDAMLKPIRMGSSIAGNQHVYKHLSLSFATKS